MHSLSIVSLTLILTAFIGANADSVSTDISTYGINDESPYQSFISNTEVKPLELLVTTAKSGTAGGYVFLGIDGKPSSGQNVPCIYDMSTGSRMGSIVWCGLNYTEPFDFRMQTYKGEPHLTFWSGEVLNGYGHGQYYILNASYDLVEKFSPVGFKNGGDMHEFYITDDNTAIVPIYTPKQADLTSVGGDSDGWIFDCIFQEIDITTKKLLFQWNASTHVSINETYNTLGSAGSSASPFDYFHINAISKDSSGDYLVSARVVNTIYKISGTTGSIIWRLNGKNSDFTITPDDAKFVFQHDVTWVNASKQDQITLFDNQDGELSRGLLFSIDQDAKTAELVTEFKNADNTWAQFEGSLQRLDNGNYMMGFGVQPYFTELDSKGDILLDVQFGVTNVVNSYRAYKFPWVGKPSTKPDIAYVAAEKKVYVSWNGATEVESWVIATNSSGGLFTWEAVAQSNRTGFETVIQLSQELGDGALLRARAAGVDGKTLGWSDATDGLGFWAVLVSDDDDNNDDNGTSPSVTGSSSAGITEVAQASPTETTKGSAVKTGGGTAGLMFVGLVVIAEVLM